MKRMFASASCLALLGGLAATSAFAQVPGPNTAPPPTGGASPFGLGQTETPAYPPPPGEPPAGSHYEWIYTYDRHANYLGHWTLVRDR
jgi:hypothetical protein